MKTNNFIPEEINKVLEYIGQGSIWAVGGEQGLINIYAEQKLSHDLSCILSAKVFPSHYRLIVAKQPLPNWGLDIYE